MFDNKVDQDQHRFKPTDPSPQQKRGSEIWLHSKKSEWHYIESHCNWKDRARATSERTKDWTRRQKGLIWQEICHLEITSKVQFLERCVYRISRRRLGFGNDINAVVSVPQSVLSNTKIPWRYLEIRGHKMPSRENRRESRLFRHIIVIRSVMLWNGNS